MCPGRRVNVAGAGHTYRGGATEMDATWRCRDGRLPEPLTPEQVVAIYEPMRWRDSRSVIARLVATIYECDYRWSDALTEAMITAAAAAVEVSARTANRRMVCCCGLGSH